MSLFFYIRLLRLKIAYFIVRIKNPQMIIKGHLGLKNVKIVNEGKGNKILAGKHVVLRNCRFYFKGDNNQMNFGDNIHINNVTFWLENDNSTIIIGNGTHVGEGTWLCAFKGTTLKIGSNSLLAKQIMIRTYDSHGIYSLDGMELNSPHDVLIGNHVWIGEQALILKGSVIPDDCVVGARSIITSSTRITTHSIVAGVPAKIVKDAVTWKL